MDGEPFDELFIDGIKWNVVLIEPRHEVAAAMTVMLDCTLSISLLAEMFAEILNMASRYSGKLFV